MDYAHPRYDQSKGEQDRGSDTTCESRLKRTASAQCRRVRQPTCANVSGLVPVVR